MFRIGVIFGGDGSEREVSLKSGTEVCAALEITGMEVIPYRIDALSDLERITSGDRPDIFFIALHGGWGENGQLQAFLDLKGIPYTGPDHEACALSMDKWKSKMLFIESGIPTPRGILLEKGSNWDPENFQKVFDNVSRVVVKPNSCGSTLGVSIISRDDPEALSRGLEKAFRFDTKAIVETFIPGSELAVTVVEDAGAIDVFPIVEILPQEGFYSYEAKYSGGKSEYLVPAPLRDDISERAAKAAADAFRAIGCSIYSRVDIRLDLTGVPYVLEVNSVPGMTSTSLVPKAALARGLSFTEFLEKILFLSLKKRTFLSLPDFSGPIS
ncbi:MAG: D-alanine--D-alanine ligase [Synergistales bacterium]|nr:D-alanine--D-alanine ligase [Synergistales bacterium]